MVIAAQLDIIINIVFINNDFLAAQNMEAGNIITGNEFEHKHENSFLVKRALNKIKSSGSSFRYFMATKVDKVDSKSYNTYSNVWMKTGSRSDGEEY